MFCWWFIATFCKNGLFMFYSHPLGDVKSHFSHNKKKHNGHLNSWLFSYCCKSSHSVCKTNLKKMEIHKCLLGLFNNWSLVLTATGSTCTSFHIIPYLLVFWCVTYFTHIIMNTFAQATANPFCPHPKRDCEWDGHARHFDLSKEGETKVWALCCCPQWMKERRMKTSGN